MMKNIFNPEVVTEITNRIDKLAPQTKPNWGKMSVDQMLAHCNVTYEFIYTDKHPKPNAFKRFILTTFVKKFVVGEKPFAKNGRTSPEFLMTDKKNFDNEKKILVDYLIKTQKLGETHFHNKESHGFGKLTKDEWNILFYKHLNHHLTQFGV